MRDGGVDSLLVCYQALLKKGVVVPGFEGKLDDADADDEALGNVESRLYVDAQCVYSGTLGTKGNTRWHTACSSARSRTSRSRTSRR